MTTFTSPLMIIRGRSNRAIRLSPGFHCIITASQPSHNLLTLVPEIKILYNYLHQLMDFFQKRNSSTKIRRRGQDILERLMATTEREILNTPAEIPISPNLTPVEQMQAAITPQQHYMQGMEDIWEKVHQLPKGQDQVVLSQLWA